MKFLVNDQADFPEIFMVTTIISPPQNIKKLAWRQASENGISHSHLMSKNTRKILASNTCRVHKQKN
jgi:hypothetical protein